VADFVSNFVAVATGVGCGRSPLPATFFTLRMISVDSWTQKT